MERLAAAAAGLPLLSEVLGERALELLLELTKSKEFPLPCSL